MPELIGVAILAATTGLAPAVAGTLTIAGFSAATIVGSGVLIAGSLGLKLLTTPDQKQKVASQQFSSRQPLPARQRGYGFVRVAGPKVAYDSVGGAFYNAIYHCEGPVDGFAEVWLDDVLTALSGTAPSGASGVSPWLDKVQVECHAGTADQAASALLGGLPYWNAAHKLAGCAYTVVKATAPAQKNFAKFYPSSRPPEMRVTLRAAKVRDVRASTQTTDPATWVFSTRSGPCLHDFITHPTWGMKVPDALIDKASWAAFNDLCDQNVATKAGVAVPRYALGGLYLLTDDPADTLKAMLDTCDGRLVLQPDGTIGITGGQMPVPTVTLTDPIILSMTLEVGSGKLSAFNRLKTSFVSHNHDYQQTEGDPWDDLAAQDFAGEIIEEDFARPWVPEHNQLRRLAKIATAKGNPDYRITGMVTDRSGAPALFEDAIHLVLTEYGIDGVFTVERAVSNVEAGTCTFDLVSLRPDTYAFDPATEEGIAPALPNAQASAATPPTPSSLTVSIERRAVNGTTNATFARLVATADRDDLSLVGRYRAIGSGTWLTMVQDNADNAYSLVSAVLTDGAQYEVQGALATYGQTLQSDWTNATPDPITATADATAPGNPMDFSATGYAGRAVLDWTNPGSANFASMVVRRATGAGAAYNTSAIIATLYGSPNQQVEYGDTSLAAGAYTYWLVARNASGTPAAPYGGLSVTVT